LEPSGGEGLEVPVVNVVLTVLNEVIKLFGG